MQRIGESSEQFHSVLSGLAARSKFGVQESRRLTDVFLVNMTNREAQYELCRSTKTPQKVYCIALSYESGDNYTKTHVLTAGASSGTSPKYAEPPMLWNMEANIQ